MAEKRSQRRLAAILAADVVGYSRLMEADEAGTLAALKARRRDVLEPLVARHKGRIFKIVGDGVLVEFTSIVNAVQCAIDLQKGMATANRDLPDERQIILRIGVNFGDVINEDGDLRGNGIVTATLLEGLAEPGGIIVSGAAYDQIKNKVDVDFDDLSTDRRLINASQQVRAYRITDRSVVTMARRAVNDKPSIAVLPFANMSGDPEQEYFSDGITADIITELSRFRNLLVIAYHSSFVFKGKPATVSDVARKLGVTFVVEGSVRTVGHRVRITAQLIETTTGAHIWAHRYDRNIDDVFTIQDEVTNSIVAKVAGQVEATGSEIARRKTPDSLSAYEYLLRGLAHFNRFSGHDDIAEASRMFLRAIELDPGYARAHACLAFALVDEYFWNYSQAVLERAWQAAKAAVMLDDTDGRCHGALAYVLWARRSFDQAEYHFDVALRLNPHDADIIVLRGYLLLYIGRTTEALEAVDAGLMLNPAPPQWYWTLQGLAFYITRRYSEAAVALERMTGRLVWDHAYLAASYAQLCRVSDAHAAATKVLDIDPDFTISRWIENDPLRSQADIDHIADGLRKARLPE
jgi:adenylate cyclase